MNFVSRLLDRKTPVRVPSHPGGRPVGEVTFEPMRKKHIRAILVIEHQVYPRPWTLGIFHDELTGVESGERWYIVAKLDGELVGYAGMLFTLDEAHITNIAVDPSVHRLGIGTRLMRETVREAVRRESSAMSLEVRASNTAAQELYRKFGFASAGIRPKYYENVEDAMIMWNHEIATPGYLARVGAEEEQS